jgi:hypothetical protein
MRLPTLCGYRIVSDVEVLPGTRFWKCMAAVVQPAGDSDVERIYPIIATVYFLTGQAANDFIIAQAKQWIDEKIGSA